MWLSDLMTPDGDAMVVRETTHRFIPLSFHRSMVGRRLPMLLTAAGRVNFSRVLASLNVIYLAQTITPADAVRRFLPELRRAADEIADALNAQTQERDPASG